ncbi:MAG: hypothetical protein EBR67_06755, partial [Proteobacteria bacterium]|nr:hypothetical protein [Pseudomonadota bacterium]
MVLHVGIAESERAQRLPPRVARPCHRRTLAEDTRRAAVDAVVDTRLIEQLPVKERTVGHEAGAVARSDEGVDHAAVDAHRPHRRHDPLARARHLGDADADLHVLRHGPADEAHRGHGDEQPCDRRGECRDARIAPAPAP